MFVKYKTAIKICSLWYNLFLSYDDSWTNFLLGVTQYLLKIKNCRILIPEVNLITVILRYNSTIGSAELWCYDESGDR